METINQGSRKILAQRMLEQIPLDNAYTYQLLKPEHIERVVQMFTVDFCDNEPMTRYINMPYDSFSLFARAVTTKAAADGLSVIALDGDTVIACALVEDLTKPVAFNFELDPKFNPIFNLLEGLSAKLMSGRIFTPTQIAHLFITAVDVSYQRRGLSRQVNFRAMALAVDKGYAYMLSELTNYYNERGIIPHLRYNKLRVGLQVYKDFVFENDKPFANLASSASGWLWELRKNPKLTYEENGNSVSNSLLDLS